MKTAPFDSAACFAGYSGWSFFCALLSIFAITGYYSDLLHQLLPDWVAVAIFILPVVIILFIQWGEAPDRLVAISHVVATAVFMCFALGMEIGGLLGYQPEGALLYRLLAHLGWTFAWAGIYRRTRTVPRT